MVTLVACVVLLVMCAVALTIATRPPDVQTPDLITVEQLMDVYVMLHDFEEYMGRDSLKPHELDSIAAFDSFYRAVSLGS